MKQKTNFPDWDNPVDLIIRRGEASNGGACVWSDYTRTDNEWLVLRVTIEIAGSLYDFETHESKEAKERARVEKDRQAAWRSAIKFAHQMWKDAPHREYVISFRQYNTNIGREAVCIYQRLQGVK